MFLVFNTKLFIVKTRKQFLGQYPGYIYKSKNQQKEGSFRSAQDWNRADLRNPPPSLVVAPVDQWTNISFLRNILITLTFGIPSEKL